MKIPQDNRKLSWRYMEKNIQLSAGRKDSSFVLKGRWKKFVRCEQGYKVFAVDGNWIRANLCFYFGHGGHELVHEFIPHDEIWVATHHYSTRQYSCLCKVRKKGQKCSKNYFDSTVIHEITECEKMKRGKSYWESHHIAIEKEKQAGLLLNPFYDK